MFQTFMEYTIHDIFLESGWERENIIKTDLLRKELPLVTRDLGFEYVDWTDIVNDFAEKERTILSRFALYVDHVHLSPLGNRLAAEKLYELLRTWRAVS